MNEQEMPIGTMFHKGENYKIYFTNDKIIAFHTGSNSGSEYLLGAIGALVKESYKAIKNKNNNDMTLEEKIAKNKKNRVMLHSETEQIIFKKNWRCGEIRIKRTEENFKKDILGRDTKLQKEIVYYTIKTDKKQMQNTAEILKQIYGNKVTIQINN